MVKQIAILGSTGSIGCQTLEVVDQHPERFRVAALTAQNRADLLIEQALKYCPALVVIANEALYNLVRDALSGAGIRVAAGEEGLMEAATLPQVDTVVTALVGASGLKPTIAAIEAGKDIALANKETLVIAGELVMALAKKHNVNLFPIDSEHSAIQQCLMGEDLAGVDKIILTASGGPFRGFSKEQLSTVTLAQALKHPNWSMGRKITIDSATLMNKGLEVIEARWLFGVTQDRIDVVVHPQSIIHSMVQFADGSIKAQLGLPDMRLPIQFALTYPERATNAFPRTNFFELKDLTFQKPDLEAFPCLAMAFEALRRGGTAPCVLNAANEIAVEAFLQERIGFAEIPETLKWALNSQPQRNQPTIAQLLEDDTSTRASVKRYLKLESVS